MEGNFLDQEVRSGTDEDSSDHKVGFLAVDALFVGVSTSSSKVVEETDMGGIGRSIRNQIIQHFLVHFIPSKMIKH